MNARPARATLVAMASAAFVGCASSPTAAPSDGPFEPTPHTADRALSPHPVFERTQRERALQFELQRQLADAALTWEVLVVLRPDVGEYRERLADLERQIDSAVAQRLPRAAQAARRGENDAAIRHYLAVLALQPQNEQAANALRALERERNKRNWLGKPAYSTRARRSAADAELPSDSR